MLQADLKILGGKHQGKLISLNTKKFLVGREQDCHLRPNSDLVSRHHCVFSVDDYSIRLRDLGSTNGTLVNGESIRGEIILKAGDRVTIGKLELEVSIRQSSEKRISAASSNPPASSAKPVQQILATENSTPVDEVDTSYELPAFAPPADTEVVGSMPADTAIIGSFPPPPLYQQPAPMGYPQSYPQMMPPGYQMPGQMPGGYMPPQFPQYPPQGYGQMPGYAQPMGYPMNYPQMMPMQPGYPLAGAAATPVAEPEISEPEAAQADAMAVKLPNPEDTGAKPIAPPANAAPGAKKEEKPSTTAADIIKQYMNRRS